MCKQSMVLPGRLFCGIDVSAVSLAVAVQREEQPIEEREFPNNASGHKLLITWLRKRKTAVRVTREATGIYSFDLSVALHATDGIELAVLNPKVANRFAQTLRRSKTDSADAQVLAEYSRRMPFTAWCSPNHNELQLRTICRHVESLTVQHTRDQNRLYAAQGSISTPRCVIQDLKHALAAGERRIHKLRREAMTLVRSDENLRQRYDLLISIPGVAQISAMQLLGELATLSPDMTVRQWVAHSGLDPAHEISGTSVRKASRISRAGNRHLRRALYMPALVASRCDPHGKAFFESLLARNKARLQALIAVARKLLHAIYGMFRSGLKYEGTKLFPRISLS
jgi:transposase